MAPPRIGRHREPRRWKDNINKDIREIGVGGEDAQDSTEWRKMVTVAVTRRKKVSASALALLFVIHGTSVSIATTIDSN